jgi:hypothetical protein
MNRDESWFDDEAGALIRPFAVTGGRARTDRDDLTMITLLTAVRPLANSMARSREYAEIVRMCTARPMSVAEIAAKLTMLLTVAKVLISDLIDDGYLIRSALPLVDVPDMKLLQAVLDGVRRL